MGFDVGFGRQALGRHRVFKSAAAPKATQVPYLSVVVPCYNERCILDALLQRLLTVCSNTARSFEIVFVDDGSVDGTLPHILAWAAADPRIGVVRLARNFGHQEALLAGLRAARGERVLTLDADLQDPPELLPAMMAKMDAGAELVFGQRIRRPGESWLKRATAALFYRALSRWSRTPIPLDVGDFRLVSRRALRTFLRQPQMPGFLRGGFAWMGYRQEMVPYVRPVRQAGASHYAWQDMLTLALSGLVGFSQAPTHILGSMAWICSALACGGVGVGLSLAWMHGPRVQMLDVGLLMLGGVSGLLAWMCVVWMVMVAYLDRMMCRLQGLHTHVVEDFYPPGKIFRGEAPVPLRQVSRAGKVGTKRRRFRY